MHLDRSRSNEPNQGSYSNEATGPGSIVGIHVSYDSQFIICYRDSHNNTINEIEVVYFCTINISVRVLMPSLQQTKLISYYWTQNALKHY